LQSRILSDNKQPTSRDLVGECEELCMKYPEQYDQFRVSLIAIKVLVKRQLTAKDWDNVGSDLMFNYHTYYEIREILSVGKQNGDLDDDD